MISKVFSYINRNLLKKNINRWQNWNAYEFSIVNFPIYLKIKLNPGISRHSSLFCPVIPSYGKASKISNPDKNLTRCAGLINLAQRNCTIHILWSCKLYSLCFFGYLIYLNYKEYIFIYIYLIYVYTKV